MRILSRTFLSVALVFGLAAASDASQIGLGSRHTRNATDDARRVAALCSEWARLWSKKDLEPLIELYAEDAVFLPANGARVTGRAAIRDLFRKALETNSSKLQVRSIRAQVEGKLAFDSGDYEEQRADGTPAGRGQYLIVCRRDAKGVWRIIEHVWTDAPAGSH